MGYPRVGRSFMPNGNMVSESEIDADTIVESNHGVPILDLGILNQGIRKGFKIFKIQFLLVHLFSKQKVLFFVYIFLLSELF